MNHCKRWISYISGENTKIISSDTKVIYIEQMLHSSVTEYKWNQNAEAAGAKVKSLLFP